MNANLVTVMHHLASHFALTGAQRLNTPFDVSGLDFKADVAPALRRLASAEPPYIEGIVADQVDYPVVVTGLTERGWEAVEAADDFSELTNMPVTTSPTPVIRGSVDSHFQVALSFAGEQRPYVQKVAAALAKKGVSCFYDEDQQITLWGKNLAEELQRIYMDSSHTVVIFVSHAYAERIWTNHERRAALSRALRERREYVLPVRFDATELSGLSPDISYLKASLFRPEELADAIVKKLTLLGSMPRVDRTASILELAASVTKLAVTIWIEPTLTGDAKPITDLLHKHIASRMEQHRLEQLFAECTRIVATKLLSLIDREFRAVSQDEREAAILVLRNTLDKAVLDRNSLAQSDLTAGRVIHWVKQKRNLTQRSVPISENMQDFYNLMLEESCRYLVEIVITLPRFEAGGLHKVLSREREIMETLNQILGRGRAKHGSPGFTADYYRLLEHKLDHMELFGITLFEESSRIYPLTVSYISLTLMERSNKSDDGTANQRVEQALAGKSRTLLIGEAGSGKTTLLRWIAVRACRSDFTGSLRAWNGCVPFFLPLRTFADGNFPPPERFLEQITPTIAAEIPPTWVHDQLRNGRALVLVDGVDELAPGDIRDAARAWLEELITVFPKAHYIVTSRPAAASELWTRMTEFSIAVIQPMDASDVRHFIRRWHDAMRWGITEDVALERTNEEERALLAAIDEDRLLRSLTENPLLCALLCALNRDRHGNLPRQRMAIYQAALAMLLERRDVGRKMERTVPYTANDLTILLQDLAYWLLENGWSDVPIARAEAQLERSMRSLRYTGIKASTLLSLLLERSGLLRSPVDGHLDFVHRMFQEYLAGKAAMDNDVVGEIVGRAAHDQWHDVIVMAAGHARPKQATELFRGILEQAKRYPSNESLRILSLACLQTVQRLEPELREEIRQVARTLIPPSSKEAAEAIVYAGPSVLDALAARKPINLVEASAYIRTASLIGGPDALELIGDIAESFDGLKDDLTRAWDYFRRDLFAERVLSRAKLDSGLIITDERLMQYVATLRALKRLEIADLDIQSLSRLGAAPPNVDTLIVTRCPLINLRGAENWHHVSRFELTMSGRLPDLADIKKMISLEALEFTFRMGRVVPLETISELPSLRSLRFNRMDHMVIDLRSLQGREDLTIYVPDSALVEGAQTLGSGSRLIRVENIS